MVPLNYNFIFTCMSTSGAARKLQCISVTCLHGPRFLVVWNIHISCNLWSVITCGIATHWSSYMCNTDTRNIIIYLGKYLKMPYHKNTMKHSSLSLNG